MGHTVLRHKSLYMAVDRLDLDRKKICILYGFPCEMDISHHESPESLVTRVGF